MRDQIKDTFSFVSRNLNNTKKRNELGSIYILSNVSLQGMVKIGQTSNSVEDRALELSQSTSIPTPFKIEHEYLVERPKDTELKIHRHLRKFRISSRKEFFRLSPEQADGECGFCIWGTRNTWHTIILRLENMLDFTKKYPHRFDNSGVSNEKQIKFREYINDYKAKRDFFKSNSNNEKI